MACGTEVGAWTDVEVSGSYIGRVGEGLLMGHEGGRARVAPVTGSRGCVMAPFAEMGATVIEPAFWEETLSLGHVG